ncbi:hypothetical protein J4471_01010 [Candidatus Woesearchaeota archaeon]|nr:hypothetical protein [Candidatus Woesearchaeota archaeon]
MPIDDYLTKIEGARIIQNHKVTPPKISGKVFILKYDEFGKELIAKSNKLFGGTGAEININTLGDNMEIQNINMIKRLALITTIYGDNQLKSCNFMPITPLQSENLLIENKLPISLAHWEDLALILYKPYINGTNSTEATILYTSLIKHRYDLDFDHIDMDLYSPLLIINAGLYIEEEMAHKVVPFALPGLTEVYYPPVLKSTTKFRGFNYGGDHGLPYINDIITGDRTFYLPQDDNKGLKILCRFNSGSLFANHDNLASRSVNGRAVFIEKS